MHLIRQGCWQMATAGLAWRQTLREKVENARNSPWVQLEGGTCDAPKPAHAPLTLTLTGKHWQLVVCLCISSFRLHRL